MKLGSPSQRPDAVTPSDASTAESSPTQPSDRLRDTLVDSQEPPRQARRSSSPPRAFLRAPAPVIRNVQAAQREIVKALDQGNIAIVHAVLQQSAAGRRLTEVLQSPADDAAPASYQRLADHMLAHLDDAHAARLVRAFGADLMQAMLEHHDLPRFARCCEALHSKLLPLASKDNGRLVRAAAKDLHALPVLLRHLPVQHWSGLLTAHNHEAMACLWRYATHHADADTAQSAPRALAFDMLREVFAQVPPEQLHELHQGFLVQRQIQPARHNFPTQMQALRTLLVQRGGAAPWDDP